MDPQNDLPDLVEDLEVNIDELSDILSPLLNAQLSTTASTLPLLEKSKLYVLAAYSIESLLYSTLQASGVNAKDHPIFKELARLKGYFAKIKDAEERAQAPTAPKAKLDVGAAARFIKHGLAGNDKYDLERAERVAKERARAYLKAQRINKKFDENGEEKTENMTPKKRAVDVGEAPEAAADSPALEEPEAEPTTATEPAPKKPRLSEAQPMDVDSAPSDTNRKKGKKQRNKKIQNSTSTSEVDAEDASQDTSDEPPRTKRKQRNKKGKAGADETEQGMALPSRTSKSRSEAKSHADGASPDERKRRGRPKKAK
ncbi:hypothetical protein GQ44DRAFT_704904 [Phaeosphaeriaceae sp. PMI808]|nr:hypothetical protein GQ44DRAFT_704904 [Phaeosphaeriaceae sp. PMI808]